MVGVLPLTGGIDQWVEPVSIEQEAGCSQALVCTAAQNLAPPDITVIFTKLFKLEKTDFKKLPCYTLSFTG
jgi:hypothetical protein